MPLITATSGPLAFRYETAAPTATAVRGSIAFRADAGNVGVFQNTDGATTWRQLLPAGGSATFLTATTWTLLDASATALVIGASGAASMLTFDTTDGSEALAAGCRITTTDGVTGGTVRVVGGRASSTTADSAVITGNGAPQAFSQTYSIPANTLKAGSMLRIRGGVRRTGINGADTATVAVLVGGQAYSQSPAVAAAAGDRCNFDVVVCSRAAPGGAVTVVGTGIVGWSTAGAIQLAGGNSQALATNGAIVVSVTINMPNNAGNTAVLESFFVEVV